MLAVTTPMLHWKKKSTETMGTPEKITWNKTHHVAHVRSLEGLILGNRRVPDKPFLKIDFKVSEEKITTGQSYFFNTFVRRISKL